MSHLPFPLPLRRFGGVELVQWDCHPYLFKDDIGILFRRLYLTLQHKDYRELLGFVELFKTFFQHNRGIVHLVQISGFTVVGGGQARRMQREWKEMKGNGKEGKGKERKGKERKSKAMEGNGMEGDGMEGDGIEGDGMEFNAME